jgi:hypothetical protein
MRRAQDFFTLYNCIMNTLSEGVQKQVHNRGLVSPFAINGRESGTLPLKVVIMVSHVDTRATVTAVRTKLSSLDRAMRELESDVEKFNHHVLSVISLLYAQGEQTQDLLLNLFKGYKACKDAEFVEYIKKKEDTYEEGGNASAPVPSVHKIEGGSHTCLHPFFVFMTFNKSTPSWESS